MPQTEKPFIKYSFDKKYLIAKDKRGRYRHDLFFGIDDSNLYYQSGGGGSTHFYQNETKGYPRNTPLQQNLQQHLTRVDCIEKNINYLDQAKLNQILSGDDNLGLWISIEIKGNSTHWDEFVLFRKIDWNPETKEITYGNQYGAGRKTCSMDDISNLYYPHPKIEKLNLNKAVLLLKQAALIIDENNKENSERGEYGNINIVSDINRFLDKEDL